ncbi:MAG: thermonuclease family protein [Candidatus Moranbacteria bacterium]|nr:thermonuclease family protein [Candidatus Moranbacteria bacterium]
MKKNIAIGIISVVLLIFGVSSSDLDFINDLANLFTDSVDSKNDGFYDVVKVVDGDTLSVNIDGKVEKLRLIGIDTPETVDPRKPVQCFGREASDKAKELLSGKKVRLEVDSTQDERDRYDRLLRYVILEDGTSFNKKMIQEGYAHEYTYKVPYKYQAEFKFAEETARENKRGLWASDTCNGDTTQSVE